VINVSIKQILYHKHLGLVFNDRRHRQITSMIFVMEVTNVSIPHIQIKNCCFSHSN